MKLLLMVILVMVIYGMAHQKSKCATQKDLRIVKNNVNQIQKGVSAVVVNTNKTTDGISEIWEKLEDIEAELKNSNKSCGNILSEVMDSNKNMLTKLAVVEDMLETLLHHVTSNTTGLSKVIFQIENDLDDMVSGSVYDWSIGKRLRFYNVGKNNKTAIDIELFPQFYTLQITGEAYNGSTWNACQFLDINIKPDDPVTVKIVQGNYINSCRINRVF